MKYKIEIVKTYCIDIETQNETDQNTLNHYAEQFLDRAMLAGSEHYLQTGDTEFVVYDVTHTDDPFTSNIIL